jgi:hypothetical protein
LDGPVLPFEDLPFLAGAKSAFDFGMETDDMAIGRPSLKTDETIDIICDARAHGLSLEDSAACGDVTVMTLYNWMESDPEIAEKMRVARAKRKLHLVKRLETAEPKSWMELAWLLERLDINFSRPEIRLQYLLHQEGGTDNDDAKTKVVKALELIDGKASRS